ncbi:hypothetical protein HK101_012022 [Irineochytrium annulatum]|nr:hypothetical protein HK101_012022 [Irineochytrium annulatum]
MDGQPRIAALRSLMPVSAVGIDGFRHRDLRSGRDACRSEAALDPDYSNDNSSGTALPARMSISSLVTPNEGAPQKQEPLIVKLRAASEPPLSPFSAASGAFPGAQKASSTTSSNYHATPQHPHPFDAVDRWPIRGPPGPSYPSAAQPPYSHHHANHQAIRAHDAMLYNHPPPPHHPGPHYPPYYQHPGPQHGPPSYHHYHGAYLHYNHYQHQQHQQQLGFNPHDLHHPGAHPAYPASAYYHTGPHHATSSLPNASPEPSAFLDDLGHPHARQPPPNGVHPTHFPGPRSHPDLGRRDSGSAPNFEWREDDRGVKPDSVDGTGGGGNINGARGLSEPVRVSRSTQSVNNGNSGENSAGYDNIDANGMDVVIKPDGNWDAAEKGGKRSGAAGARGAGNGNATVNGDGNAGAPSGVVMTSAVNRGGGGRGGYNMRDGAPVHRTERGRARSDVVISMMGGRQVRRYVCQEPTCGKSVPFVVRMPFFLDRIGLN